MITYMVDKPQHLHLLLYFLGSAAFRGAARDCESRSLSGNHREVHLSTQVQEGEQDTYGSNPVSRIDVPGIFILCNVRTSSDMDTGITHLLKTCKHEHITEISLRISKVPTRLNTS